VENKYWEYNKKPFKESNWKALADVVHIMQISLLEYELETSSKQVKQNAMNMNWK